MLTASLGYSILVLEWCGRLLNTFSPQELTELNPVTPCMESLRQIHSAGVVHGDLALRNIAYENSVFSVFDWEASETYDEAGSSRDRAALLASLR